jgi:uncharacterized membrane protein YhaH (DUF805 family)
MSNKNTIFADLINAVKDAFSRFIDFTGVSTRPQYWYYILATAMASAVVGIAFGENGQNALTLIMLLPTIAVSIRRMHDVGKSGWFILIPIYNIVLLASPTTVAATVLKRSLLVRAGQFVIVSPIIGAFLYSLLAGGSMFNESTGGGAFIWGLFITVPIGLILIAIGVTVELTKRSKS